MTSCDSTVFGKVSQARGHFIVLPLHDWMKFVKWYSITGFENDSREIVKKETNGFELVRIRVLDI